MCNDGSGKAKIHNSVSDVEADQSLSDEGVTMLDPKDEWVVVRYYGEQTETLVRRRYQWEAGRYQNRWEYAARGLTYEQAKHYEKLFKE